jgi:hypothetical protein
MDIIARPANGITITNEEFYLIMTKKACLVDEILALTKIQK